MFDLPPADTRVFLFHAADASANPLGAMDSVNSWLAKDRSTGQYANLRVREINVTSDGAGGVFTLIVCTLGKVVPQEQSHSATGV